MSGLTGLETAELLAQSGNRVTVIEMAGELAPGAWFQLVDDEMERLVPAGVEFRTDTELVRIEEDSLAVFDRKERRFLRIPCDFTVLSMGIRPVNELQKKLDGKVFRLISVGDALRSYTNTGAEDDPDLSKVEMSREMYDAYVNGYLSIMGDYLTPAEKEYIPFSGMYITYEQVLRFLMDYIDGDTYYKVKYPEHNLVRTRAQYKLLTSMERQLK